ncbi:MAG: TonB-dependent receptor, partial [Cytophagales bacterium]|nr:TonB-dependent receptor [Cytophagales bacterium]
AVFLGVGDVQLLNGGRYELERMRNTSNQSVSTLQRWTVENQSNTFPRATATDPNGNARTSDRWIEDGDYFRLRNLQVGYTIPQKHLNNLFNGVVTNLRFYIAGQNLFTITDYSGLDPEITVGSTFNSDLASDAPIVNGNDSGRTPAPRVFQIGIQATL